MVILIRLHRNDYVVPATSPNNKYSALLLTKGTW